MDNIKVGISIGDINGVGMEVIIKTFLDNRIMENITPVVYGSTRIASYYRKNINAQNFNFFKIDDATKAKQKKANLVNIWDEEVKLEVGESTANGGKYALKSIEAATEDLAAGKIDVLVTAPINKKNIQSENFDFPGHTEYLTKLSNADASLMLMVKDSLRVGIVTNHIPIKDVPKELTKDKIYDKIVLLRNALEKDFGIARPRIAVLGLNPHAGENGMIGEEDAEIIVPAIEKAEQEGMIVYGPYPSDGFFGSGNYTKFDGVIAMYHDQGLTPFKALAAGSGVNYTAGLPIVRTSPDHGTAYDIAGKGKASEESFRNAVLLATDIFRNRKQHKELHSNVLQPQKKK